MHFRIIFSIAVLVVLIISCKKESIFFPTNDDLKGCWEQITSDYLLDREGLCFDGQETLYYTRIVSRAIEMDTLIYGLDEKQERLYLKPADCPKCPMVPYKIQLNIENNELTIWGLHYSASESKFKKQ